LVKELSPMRDDERECAAHTSGSQGGRTGDKSAGRRCIHLPR
jgi:hypothetical protein